VTIFAEGFGSSGFAVVDGFSAAVDFSAADGCNFSADDNFSAPEGADLSPEEATVCGGVVREASK
jgi:hypothetical protein